MAKVAGIGGVFLYAKDPSGLAAWYAQHLGIEFRQDEGTEFYYLVFRYRDFDHVARLLDTTLAIFPASEPLGDTRSEYKINYRVDDPGEDYVLLPGASPQETLRRGHTLKKKLDRFAGPGRVALGISTWPYLNYARTETAVNCRKACCTEDFSVRAQSRFVIMSV